MKKLAIFTLLLVAAHLDLSAQTFKVVTSVESIVPNGFGRSRIINALEDKDYKEFTSVQTEADNTRNKADRSTIRVKNFEETKL